MGIGRLLETTKYIYIHYVIVFNIFHIKKNALIFAIIFRWEIDSNKEIKNYLKIKNLPVYNITVYDGV